MSAGATTSTSSPTRTRAYSMSGPTATATFPGSVHGVVVQISSLSPSRSGDFDSGEPAGPPADPVDCCTSASGPPGVFTGNRTYTDGSTTSLYPSATSCEDSAVPQR